MAYSMLKALSLVLGPGSTGGKKKKKEKGDSWEDCLMNSVAKYLSILDMQGLRFTFHVLFLKKLLRMLYTKI